MSIQLTILALEREAEELPRITVFNQDEITVGRDMTNDVVLDSPHVALHHAKIRVSEDDAQPGLYIMDLGSETGVILEDEKIEPMVEVALPMNKRFTIGSFLIKPSSHKGSERKRRRKPIINKAAAASEPVVEPSVEPNQKAEAEPAGIIELPYVPGSNDRLQSLVDPSPESQLTASAHSEPLEAEPLEASPAVELSALPDSALSAENAEETVEAESRVEAPEAADAQGAEAAVDQLHSAVVELTLDGEDLTQIDFVATELFTISGLVTHKGEPLADVKIAIDEVGEQVTAADGSFRFEDVLDGTESIIRVSCDGYLMDSAELPLQVEGADLVLAFAATKLLTVSGKVIHKGQPMEGVEIDGGPLGQTVTGPDGSYYFYNVPDGASYTLTARKGNFLFGTINSKQK